jgi:uncharacterized protein YdaU (DUF1376 family)
MDAAVNYYPHHIGDYAKDTRHLSMLEDGAYRRLIDVYYSHEIPLPKDEASVCRLVCARGRDEKAAVGVVLREFFTLAEDGWRHKRCDEEIEKAQDKRIKAAESAGKRWHSERYANASQAGMRTHSDGNAPNPNNQEPIAKPKEKEKAARARETQLPESFEISERVKSWATAKGFGQLEKYLEFFTGRMKANGKRYIDWDEAFMNCIREDWPQFRKATAPDYSDVIAAIKD